MAKRRKGFRCYECDEPAKHAHHVIPFSRGGTRTLPLCESCHNLVHDLSFANHSKLIKEGQERARQSGQICFRPRIHIDFATILKLKANGLSLEKIANELGVSRRTVSRCIDENT